MNKYQKAMKIYSCLEHEDTVGQFTPLDYQKARLTLQELVDRATPKKPAFDKTWEDEETKDIYNEDYSINENVCKCPNCHKRSIYDFEYGVRFNHCHECGQALDWSDEEWKK